MPKNITAVSTMPKGFITSVTPTMSRQSASSSVQYQFDQPSLRSSFHIYRFWKKF